MSWVDMLCRKDTFRNATLHLSDKESPASHGDVGQVVVGERLEKTVRPGTHQG